MQIDPFDKVSASTKAFSFQAQQQATATSILQQQQQKQQQQQQQQQQHSTLLLQRVQLRYMYLIYCQSFFSVQCAARTLFPSFSDTVMSLT